MGFVATGKKYLEHTSSDLKRIEPGPIKLLTTANSISDMKTKTVHDDIQTSIAFTYETGGRERCDWVLCVARKNQSYDSSVFINVFHCSRLPKVSKEVTPSVALAGIASGLIQNDIHDITTINADGI